MEEHPRRGDGRAHAAVVPVADDGVADRGQVHADLVGAAGLQLAAPAAARSAGRSIAGPHLVAGPGRPAAGHDGHAASGWRVERPIGASMTPSGRLGHAPHQGRVAPRRPVGPPSAATSAVYAVGVRATTSRPEVSRSRRCTMPGRCGLAHRGQLGVAGQQPVDQRALGPDRRRGARRGPAACRRRARRRPRRPRAPGRPGPVRGGDSTGSSPQVDARRTARPPPVAGRRTTTAPSMRDGAGGDERRGLAPAATGDEADDPVDPLPVERGRDLLTDRLAHRSGRRLAGCGRPAGSRARGSPRRP